MNEHEANEYVKGYLIRAEERRRARADLFHRWWECAREAAALLYRSFGCHDVYLFGSLLDPDRFKLDSDVDLAVRGLAPERYMEALGFLEESFGTTVDLVDLDKANHRLVEVVESEGVRFPERP